MGWTSRKVLITSRGKADVLGKKITKEIIAFTNNHTFTSLNPPLYMISLPTQKLATKMIEENKVFVVNFFGKEDDLHNCEQYDTRFQDQFKMLNWEKEEARTIECCRIKNAQEYIECEVVDMIKAGDSTTFIGKITSRM